MTEPNQLDELPFDQPLPGESAVAFATFREFLATGPHLRIKHFKPASGCSPDTVRDYSARFHWRERAALHAAHLATAQLEAARGVVTRQAQVSAEAWLARRESVRQDEWRAHQDLLSAAAEGLRRWNDSIRVPTLSDIAKLLELASKLGRLATGLATEHTTIGSDPVNPVRIEISAALQRVYGDPQQPEPKPIDVEAIPVAP